MLVRVFWHSWLGLFPDLYIKSFNFDFIHFSEKSVREHLRDVYATLAVGLATAAVGAAVHLFTDILRFVDFVVLSFIFFWKGRGCHALGMVEG